MADRAGSDVNNKFSQTVLSSDGLRNPVSLWADPTTHALLVNNPTGQLVPKVYDAITYTNTSSTVDTYQYYQGGTGGTLVATLTVTWTDSTKLVLVSAVRT